MARNKKKGGKKKGTPSRKKVGENGSSAIDLTAAHESRSEGQEKEGNEEATRQDARSQCEAPSQQPTPDQPEDDRSAEQRDGDIARARALKNATPALMGTPVRKRSQRKGHAKSRPVGKLRKSK